MAISNNLNELDTLLQVGQGRKKCIDYYEEVAADQYNGNCPGPVRGALQRQVHGGGDQRGDTAGANNLLMLINIIRFINLINHTISIKFITLTTVPSPSTLPTLSTLSTYHYSNITITNKISISCIEVNQAIKAWVFRPH